MLVITDKSTVGISRQSSLSGSRQTKEQSDVSVLPFICGRMEGENVMLYGHKIEHDREDALLHLAGVFRSKDDHLLRLEVDGDTSAGSHTGRVPVCRERTGVVDSEIGTSVSLHLLLGGTDEHVSHEETVVCTSTDNTDFNSVTRIPSSITIKDIDAGPGVEVVDGTFTIDLPNSFFHGFIYWTPPDIFA